MRALQAGSKLIRVFSEFARRRASILATHLHASDFSIVSRRFCAHTLPFGMRSRNPAMEERSRVVVPNRGDGVDDISVDPIPFT